MKPDVVQEGTEEPETDEADFDLAQKYWKRYAPLYNSINRQVQTPESNNIKILPDGSYEGTVADEQKHLVKWRRSPDGVVIFEGEEEIDSKRVGNVTVQAAPPGKQGALIITALSKKEENEKKETPSVWPFQEGQRYDSVREMHYTAEGAPVQILVDQQSDAATMSRRETHYVGKPGQTRPNAGKDAQKILRYKLHRTARACQRRG